MSKKKVHVAPFVGGLVIDSKECDLVFFESKDESILLPKISMGLFDKVPIIRGVFRTLNYLRLKFKAMVMTLESMSNNLEGNKKRNYEKMQVLFLLSVLIGSIISLALFIVLPAIATSLFATFIKNRMVLSFIEGIIRLILFFIVLRITHLIPEIKKMYMYHGAEHKIKNCILNKLDLSFENAKKQPLYYKNCSQYNLIIMAIIIIIYFSAFRFSDIFLYNCLIRLAVVPILIGILYEFKDSFASNKKPPSRFVKVVERFYVEEPEDKILITTIDLFKKINKGDI